MITELYRLLRPKEWDEVIGQDKAVHVLKKKLEDGTLPHTVLFSGPTGSGKTTLARIVADKLGCVGHNVIQQNCAEVRGIDSVRDIQQIMHLAPMGGKARVWILDEVVQLPKTTQQAFLTVLEDTPPHVWFLLCGSDIAGLLPTFKGRCFQVILNSLMRADISTILSVALDKTKRSLTPVIRKEVVDRADGNARKALQMLEAVLTSEDSDKQLEILGVSCEEQEAKVEFLAKALLRRDSWIKIAAIIKEVEDKDLESYRWGILKYASAVLANGREAKMAYLIIQSFEEPWTWCGKAGLYKAAYQCVFTG